MIAIIDYGVGNIFNVSTAIKRMDENSILTKDADTILSASHIILPGVGAFGDAMSALKTSGLDQIIKEASALKIPILGICLGMQLLYEVGYENGITKGLGLLPGSIQEFEATRVPTIPHMGWNELHHLERSPFSDIKGYTYFVHSYLAQDDPATVYAYANYGHVKVPAIVGKGHLYGMQFHPEKSSVVGEKLLKAFYTQSTRR